MTIKPPCPTSYVIIARDSSGGEAFIMQFIFRPMAQGDAEAVAGWHRSRDRADSAG
jgi:hypothetical protein